MKKKLFKNRVLYMAILLFSSFSCGKGENQEPYVPQLPIAIPTEGNSWFLRNVATEQLESFDFKDFIWASSNDVLRTYFRVEKGGKLDIGIRCKVSSGTTELDATFNGETKRLTIDNTTNKVVFINSFDIPSAGYYYIDLKGIKKSSAVFAEINAVMLGNTATESGVNYVNEEYFYWGRRGPSVHLAYQVPTTANDIVYFYNEITVPEGNDVIGSYYMANGFKHGYFGIQVNSATERRVLFSVWSPYNTDNPGTIPADQRVILIAKGANVNTNDFGGEGSGGQSYLIYNWKAGNTYRFLLKGAPDGSNNTIYTAYFYAPEIGNWSLIASWKRPYSDNVFLQDLYSFLENFATNTGPIGRMAYYDNQWVYDTNGQWLEVISSKFTADQTARSNARLDFAGGLSGESRGFYLRNCGFFSDYSKLDESHTRTAKGTAPDINFGVLPSD